MANNFNWFGEKEKGGGEKRKKRWQNTQRVVLFEKKKGIICSYVTIICMYVKITYSTYMYMYLKVIDY